MRIFRCILFMSWFFYAGIVVGDDQVRLKESDVHKLMDQIFKEHVDKKEISSEILKNAFTVYIDQFDPHRIYLMQDEVRFYLQPTESESRTVLKQYGKNDIAPFKQLHNLIKSAIIREQGIRKDLISNPAPLFESAKKQIPQDWLSEELSFAENVSQLKKRVHNDIVEFIQSKTLHLGPDLSAEKKQEILKRYNLAMDRAEASYLGVDEKGNPLSEAEQENLFAMHILKALTSSLDAHSKFLDRVEAFDMKVRLKKEYQGIGVELRQIGENLVITRLLEGGPAVKSGKIQVNDKIIKIDGREIADEPLDVVLGWLHDPSNPTITLVLERTVKEGDKSEDKQITVKLVPAKVNVNEGRAESAYKKIDNGIIGVITLHSFYRSDTIDSEHDVRAAIEKLQQTGNLSGLILDLRDNTGGFLTEAIQVAGLFISKGIIVISKYSNGEEQVYRDVDNIRAYNGPLVILTSRETASAAEIVAEALQDYGVALIVGDEHTYGKGTIQSQTVTSSDSKPYLKVTVGKYYTVSGHSPQGKGVKADITVPGFLSETRIGEQYLEHVEPGGEIASNYDDELKDVPSDKKDWYLHYYTPSLQHKMTLWKNMVPELARRSQKRMLLNQGYQQFLVDLKTIPSWEVIAYSKKQKDYQLEEAYEIVNDMIKLEHNTNLN